MGAVNCAGICTVRECGLVSVAMKVMRRKNVGVVPVVISSEQNEVDMALAPVVRVRFPLKARVCECRGCIIDELLFCCIPEVV